MRTSLKSAADLAAKGWHVFPVRATDKRPLVKWGTTEPATTDPEQVRAWWERWPDARVGIAVGRSNVAVVDFDSGEDHRHDGLALAEVLDFETEPADGRPGGTSAGGHGKHLFYRMEPGRPCGNAASVNGYEGIDVRGLGGYVLLGRYELPRVTEVTEALPEAFQTEPGSKARALPEQVAEWLAEHSGEPSDYLAKYVQRIADAGIFRGNDEVMRVVAHVVKSGEERHSGAAFALDQLREAWLWSPHGEDDPDGEFERAVAAAIGDAVAKREVLGAEFADEPLDGDDDEVRWDIGPDELIALAQRAEAWLIRPLLPAEAVATFAGEPGLGKSFTALSWAWAIASGRAWFGHAVEQGTAAYVLGEGFARFGKRLEAWEALHGQAPRERLRFIDGAGHGVNLSDTAHVKLLRAQLRRIKPALVVLDTFAMLAQVESENDNAQVGNVYRVAAALSRELVCTVLVVHHTNKGTGSVRGASAFRGNADAVIVAKRGKDAPGSFVLSTRIEDDGKQRDGEPVKLEGFSIASPGVLVRADVGDPLANGIFEVLGFADKPMSKSEIVRALEGLSVGYTERTLRDRLDGLVAEGSVERSGEGRWTRYERATV